LLLALSAFSPAYSQATAAREPKLAIVINLPAFRLDVRLDSMLLRSFTVAIGMRRYPTPAGEFAITEVEWNPWWHPPESPWASEDTVTPPGPRNPMGRVKMALGGTLYVHGTPLAASIGSAASHACIRMTNTNAITLARLVQSHGGAELTEEATDTILQRGKPSRRVRLTTPIPVQVVYRLVELQEDELHFYPDVYRRGREGVETDALLLLSEAGHDTSLVDRRFLARVARDGGRAPVRVRISQLVAPPR
jgi:murein L,D-transpeptidase YcbB/YkuD